MTRWQRNALRGEKAGSGLDPGLHRYLHASALGCDVVAEHHKYGNHHHPRQRGIEALRVSLLRRRFVLAARRPSAPLGNTCGSYPGRGPSAAPTVSTSQALKNEDGFLDLRAFPTHLSEHLQDVHAGRIARLFLDSSVCYVMAGSASSPARTLTMVLFMTSLLSGISTLGPIVS
jgi:hypothetical protein